MRGRRGLVGAVLVGTVLLPSVAVAAPGQLPETRDRLEQARGGLADAEEALATARVQVADADARLAGVTAELAALEDRLAEAVAAAARASAEERHAAQELAAANATTQARVDTWRETHERLGDRAVDAYKHGRLARGAVLVGGVAGSADLHELAVTFETVERLLDRDQKLVERSLAVTREQVAVRRDVAEVRADAVASAEEATARRRQVGALVDQHEALVRQVAEQRSRRQDALDSIAADHAQRAVLVRQLASRVAALELSASRVVVDVSSVPFDGPMPPWADAVPGHGRRWAPPIAAAASRSGVDARLLAALVWTESSFRPGAVSHAGARGLAQLMPGTAAGLGVDPDDPMANLIGGATYLRQQLNRFERIDLALAAYNAGPGRVEAAGGRVPDIVEAQLYVVHVLERYERLVG